MKIKNNSLYILVSTAFLCQLFFTYYVLDLGFVSDSAWYLRDSKNLTNALFNRFHVPLYPLIIAFFNFITFNLIPSEIIMVVINYFSFLFGVILIQKIIFFKTKDNSIASFCALLFAFWPFVGMTNSIRAVADSPSILLFLYGLYCLNKNMVLKGIFSFSLSIITHKAMWPYSFLTLLLFLIFSKNDQKKLSSYLFIFFAPIFILYVAGVFYFNSFIWIISTNLDVEMKSHSSFFIFDGLFGSFFSGSNVKILKSSLLLIIFLGSISLLIKTIKNKLYLNDFNLLPIICTSIFYFIILNQHEILAALRFGKLLVIPFGLIFYKNSIKNNFYYRYIFYFLFVGLIYSQFFFIYYVKLIN